MGAYAIRVPTRHTPELYKKREKSAVEVLRSAWETAARKHGPLSPEAKKARESYELLRGRAVGKVD